MPVTSACVARLRSVLALRTHPAQFATARKPFFYRGMFDASRLTKARIGVIASIQFLLAISSVVRFFAQTDVITLGSTHALIGAFAVAGIRCTRVRVGAAMFVLGAWNIARIFRKSRGTCFPHTWHCISSSRQTRLDSLRAITTESRQPLRP